MRKAVHDMRADLDSDRHVHAYSYTPTLARLLLHAYSYTPTLTRLLHCRRVCNYLLLGEPIGKGSFGTIWRARMAGGGGADGPVHYSLNPTP
jgi:hypothetical protein